jgi:hypothetical protein
MTDLKQAAMQQALEALEGELWKMLDKPVDEQYRVRYAYLLRVITALREALAQPPLPVQPEPLEYWNAVEGWGMVKVNLDNVKIDEVREHFNTVNCGMIYKHGNEGRVPLYTAPPQREWVGLTEEEIEAIGDKVANERLVGLVSNFRVRLARAIEAKLKEKNNV